MSGFQFKIPESFKKTISDSMSTTGGGNKNAPVPAPSTARMTSAPMSAVRRPQMSYKDLDDPEGAPDRPPPVRMGARREHSGFVRRPVDRGANAPAKNPYVLKRTSAILKRAKQGALKRTSHAESTEEHHDSAQAAPSVSLLPPAPTRPSAAPMRTIQPLQLSSLRSKQDVLRSLRALFGRRCETDFDRYQLLDERDKLLCKLRELEDRKEESKVGACPDMCPEKERYVRIVQKRLAGYECDENGAMQPTKTVKEYSRSAADQEEPLPHELRPGVVLVRTMDYLLTEIGDAMPPVNGDACSTWYDFLWSRTRAIRKELTQQMLSDTTAVGLVEKCTRLHIFVSYGLCSLDQMAFDPNLNSENLGKCLQSLRHLYEDLAKKGIYCESEAEFRAYDVLLHLGDTNILRQVLSYRREVRNSRAIRLALQLGSAMESNNYARFFRLLKTSASFLECCICHRYFDQMRCAGWTVMVSSYQKSSLMPIAFVCRNLGFDSEEHTMQCARDVGVRVAENDNTQLVFIKELFSLDGAQPTLAVKWIEEKRNGRLLSQILSASASVCSPLPTAPPPVNSFDAHACYTRDPVLAAYVGASSMEDAAEQHAAAAPPRVTFGAAVPQASGPPAAGGATAFGGFGKSASSFSFLKPTVPPAAVPTVPPGPTKEELAAQREKEKREKLEKMADTIAEEYFVKVLDECIRSTVNEVHLSERLAHKQRQELEKREAKKKEMRAAAEQITEQLMKEVVEKELRLNVKQNMRTMYEETVERISTIIRHRLWNEHFMMCVEKEIRTIVKHEIHAEEERVRKENEERESRMAEVKRRLHELWLRQFADHWLSYVRWKKARKQRIVEARMNIAVNSTSPPVIRFPPSDRPPGADRPPEYLLLMIKAASVQRRIIRNRVYQMALYWREKTATRKYYRQSAERRLYARQHPSIRVGESHREWMNTTELPPEFTISRSEEKVTRTAYSFLDPDDSFFVQETPKRAVKSSGLMWNKRANVAKDVDEHVDELDEDSQVSMSEMTNGRPSVLNSSELDFARTLLKRTHEMVSRDEEEREEEEERLLRRKKLAAVYFSSLDFPAQANDKAPLVSLRRFSSSPSGNGVARLVKAANNTHLADLSKNEHRDTEIEELLNRSRQLSSNIDSMNDRVEQLIRKHKSRVSL